MSATLDDPSKLLTAEDAKRYVAERPLWERSLTELVAWEPARLRAAVEAAVDSANGSVGRELAEKLDEIFLRRFAEIASSSHSTAQDLRALTLLIGAVGRDDIRAQLDRMDRSYVNRWRAMTDMVTAVLGLRRHTREVVDQTQPVVNESWRRAADALVAAGQQGLTWDQLAQALTAPGAERKSKGRISQIVNAMQGQGWLEAVRDAKDLRSKVYFAGPKIHELKERPQEDKGLSFSVSLTKDNLGIYDMGNIGRISLDSLDEKYSNQSVSLTFVHVGHVAHHFKASSHAVETLNNAAFKKAKAQHGGVHHIRNSMSPVIYGRADPRDNESYIDF